MNTSHFPSLELCKKLTEAGFPITERYTRDNDEFYRYDQLISEENPELPKGMYVRPSVMELLDEIPENNTFELFNQGDNQWTLTWYYTDDEEQKNRQVEYRVDTLPNALAEMWLWLKENNYLP